MYAVVRVRGTVHIIPDIKKTLSLLSLNRCNHCTLVNETPQMKGMLRKAKDYITWGEVDAATLSKLLEYRARLVGDKKLVADDIKVIGFKSCEDLAGALVSGKLTFKDVTENLGVKHVLRLHPPARGYEGIKRAYRVGGALGYRGVDINKLLSRMLLADEKGDKSPAQGQKQDDRTSNAGAKKQSSTSPPKAPKTGKGGKE
jgi:large subunit ribosomal protein L30